MAKRTSDLDRWLAEGQQLVSQLQSRRTQLQAELADVDKQLAQFPQATTAGPRDSARQAGRTGPRRRRSGGKTLPATVEQVLREAKRPMSVKEIEPAVLKAGYKTKAKTLYNQIFDTLKKIGAKKVAKGQYTM